MAETPEPELTLPEAMERIRQLERELADLNAIAYRHAEIYERHRLELLAKIPATTPLPFLDDDAQLVT